MNGLLQNAFDLTMTLCQGLASHFLQVLYSGKCTALGIKQGGPSAGKWAELPITKSPKVAQVATGHDGQHALIVAEDGATFFVGTPRRGEDGDSSLCTLQFFPKPFTPLHTVKHV